MSLLEQAIIDAQELKEAALKSAESTILEKYSADIKEAVDSMLGQEDEEDPFAMAPGIPPEDAGLAGLTGEDETLPEEEIPYAADAELKLCPCPDDDKEITISFDQLQAMAGELPDGEGQIPPEEELAMAMGAPEEGEEEDAIPMMENIDLDDLLEACGEMMPMDPMDHSMDPMDHEEEEGGNTIVINLEEVETSFDAGMSAGMEADTDMDMDIDMDDTPEVDVDALMEMVREALSMDVSEADRGEDWAGEPEAERKHEDDTYAAKESDSKEENEALEIRMAEAKKAIGAKDAQIKDLKEKLQTLAESSDKLKQTFMLVREQFEETNLSNAKLLYTNRTLKSTSLNERQKNRIADSIQAADSIEEAKVIYETLQSTVGESRKSTPKSLNEAISRPSISMPRRRKVNSPVESLVKDRFQALAGIKK